MANDDQIQEGWITLIIVTLSIFTIVIDKTFMNVAPIPKLMKLY